MVGHLDKPITNYEASLQLLVQTSPAKGPHLQMRHPLKIAGGVISLDNCSMWSLYAIWKWVSSMYQDVAQLSVGRLFNAAPTTEGQQLSAYPWRLLSLGT